MAKQNVLLSAFNRGIISKLALARTDLKRTALSAEIQNNYMPRSLGSMMLRPGYEYIDFTLNNSTAPAIHIPFIFSVDDTAILEFTASAMRVRVNEAIISRPAVTAAVTNGNFDTNLTGWNDEDETGATSSWAVGGYMSLVGTKFNAAIRTQQVTVNEAGTEHALKILINRGQVTLRVGSTNGADDYISETSLATGEHNLAFTPTGNFWIYLSSKAQAASLISSVNIASSGDMSFTIGFTDDDLPLIRYCQSGDVVFCACDGFQQFKVERRAIRSWSVVEYAPKDGPFRAENTGTTHLTPSATSGDITLTASSELFQSTHVGALFRITSIGQTVSASVSGEDQFTDAIRITGVGSQREFDYAISNTWVGTITLQRSLDVEGAWTDYNTYTANASNNLNDGLDNQIVFYRIGFKTGDYVSGTADLSLTYSSGGLTGVVRVTQYSSATSVSAAVLDNLGGTTGSSDWAEGEWSFYRGFPSANAFHEGRLWWAGKDKIIGSVSDAFESFDDTIEGDSGPINRSIGEGPVDRINWLLPLLRLMVGTEMAEHSARSSSLDEPLTPTNFNLKVPSTRGSSAVAPIKIDSSGLFVRLNRLFELAYNETYSVNSDYGGTDLTVVAPEVGGVRFTRLAIQRYPDTRVHCLRDDGKVAVLVFDRAEDVKCWVTVETDGEVEDVFVMPALQGDLEDKVYYLVKRTIDSTNTTRRYLERWAFENECAGGTTTYDGDSATVLDADYPDGTVVTLRDVDGAKIGLNLTVSNGQVTLASAVTYATITPSLYKLSDSHVVYSGPAVTTFTATHLANEEVVIWGDGKDLGTYTLNASGQVTIPSVETYCGGLAYTARYKSTKLAYAAQGGTALTQRKRVNYLGAIFVDTHAQGLQYGSDFDSLDDLPLMEDEVEVDGDYIWPEYDKDSFEFNGDYYNDSRVCLQSQSPRPCNLLALVIGLETNEKV